MMDTSDHPVVTPFSKPAVPPPHDWRFKAGRLFMFVGLAVLFLSSAFAYHGREPFATWFFHFAWWSYILFIDGWVYRHRGESLLLSHPGRFLFLAAWSVVLWFVFEAFNLRLLNWSYRQLPLPLTTRWIGYVTAFATVVPGLLETTDLLDTAGLVRSGKIKPLGWKKSVEPLFFLSGILMLVLPLAWPRFFFPLVWVGFIFLLEPLNERWGSASLLSDWRTGQMRRFFLLLLSGFLCGGLWEWWNSWARAQWTYQLPFVGDGKIFEMPVLGYLGFPPFAVAVFVMTSFVLTLWQKSPKAVRVLLFITATAFSVGMCALVDRYTFRR